MKKIIILSTAIGLITLNACKRKYDLPPKKADLPNSGSITIDSIYARYHAYYNNCVGCLNNGTPSKFYQFPDNTNLTCTVTADEVSGNIYKSVYVKDATGYLQIKLANSGGLSVGDQIRINLNGVILNDYAQTVKLDSVDIEKNVQKISSGNKVTPLKTTFNEILNFQLFNGVGFSPLQSALVTLDSVEFDAGSKNVPYSEVVNKSSVDRDLINWYGTTGVVVRSSGYSNFASKLTPSGKLGKITAIVSQYKGTIQLIIRDIREVIIPGGTLPYLQKNFEDINLTSGGWTTYNVTGSNFWTIGTINGNYANASNYVNGTNFLCENWLISPSIDLTATNNPALTFKSATKYPGPAIQVYVSTNYVSGNPTSAIWTALSPNLSLGNFVWVGSGLQSLSAYKQSNVHVAFKYSGTASTGATWEIDNIGILEN